MDEKKGGVVKQTVGQSNVRLILIRYAGSNTDEKRNIVANTYVEVQ